MKPRHISQADFEADFHRVYSRTQRPVLPKLLVRPFYEAINPQRVHRRNEIQSDFDYSLLSMPKEIQRHIMGYVGRPQPLSVNITVPTAGFFPQPRSYYPRLPKPKPKRKRNVGLAGAVSDRQAFTRNRVRSRSVDAIRDNVIYRPYDTDPEMQDNRPLKRERPNREF